MASLHTKDTKHTEMSAWWRSSLNINYMIRGSGVLPKEQHSWNISETKENGGSEGSYGIVDGMPFSRNLLLPVTKLIGS